MYVHTVRREGVRSITKGKAIEELLDGLNQKKKKIFKSKLRKGGETQKLVADLNAARQVAGMSR